MHMCQMALFVFCRGIEMDILLTIQHLIQAVEKMTNLFKQVLMGGCGVC